MLVQRPWHDVAVKVLRREGPVRDPVELVLAYVLDSDQRLLGVILCLIIYFSFAKVFMLRGLP